MASVGAIGCFAVNAASYVPFIGVALLILPRGKTARDTPDSFDVRHPYAGFQAITRLPRLRGALLITFFSGLLCGPIVTFCPVLVRDVFHGDAGQFSLTVGAFGFGGVVGAMGLLAVDAKLDRRRLSSWFAVAFGLSLVAAAGAPWFSMLVAILVLAGISMSITNISANTVVQTSTTPELSGQAVSLYMLAMRGGGALGSVATGFSVNLLGIREALVINGALAILVQALIARYADRRPSTLTMA